MRYLIFILAFFSISTLFSQNETKRFGNEMLSSDIVGLTTILSTKPFFIQDTLTISNGTKIAHNLGKDIISYDVWKSDTLLSIPDWIIQDNDTLIVQMAGSITDARIVLYYKP